MRTRRLEFLGLLTLADHCEDCGGTELEIAVPAGVRPEVQTVSAEIDGKPVRSDVPVTDVGTTAIPRPLRWARGRIRDLEETQDAGGRGSRQQRPKGEAWKQELVALAKEFGLSSSLTSWVAVLRP